MFPQTLGMLICAIVAIYIYDSKYGFKHSTITPKTPFIYNKKVCLNMLPGSLQAIGNLATIFSTFLNGNAIASPLNQMSVVIATLFGVFYMKERKPQPYMTTTFVGLSLIALGALMSGFAPIIIGIQ
jgi:glucose uptake protein